MWVVFYIYVNTIIVRGVGGVFFIIVDYKVLVIYMGIVFIYYKIK